MSFWDKCFYEEKIVEVRSGRRKDVRLEMDREIFKSFILDGDDFIGSKIVDISHHGLGVMFNDGVSGLVEGNEVEFSIKFDDKVVDVKGLIKHSGAKFVGIEFKKVMTCRQEFYEYLDSRIINKYNIKDNSVLRGLTTKVDIKLTFLLLFLEALILILVFYFISVGGRDKKDFDYLQGSFIEFKDKVT